ncbi:hypothetical protein CPB84DRAFT_1759027, partial [Gymnopilus junonius]
DPSVYEPPGIDHLFPDRDVPHTVMLVVWDIDNPDLRPKDRHWAIAWQVGVASNGDPVHRQLAIVRERNAYGPLDHLANWGPKTKTAQPDFKCIPIAELDLPQGKWLEGVAVMAGGIVRIGSCPSLFRPSVMTSSATNKLMRLYMKRVA